MSEIAQYFSGMDLHIDCAAYIGGRRWWENEKGENWWNRSCTFDCDVLYYMKAGRFTLYMDGKPYCLRAGQMIFIPAGVALRYDFDGVGPLDKYFTHFHLLLGKRSLTDCFEFLKIIEVEQRAKLDALFEAYIGAQDEFGLLQKGYLLQILSVFLEEGGARIKSASCLQGAVDHIHAHLEENLSVSALAKMSGYSKDHFSRKFKEFYGRTPRQYIADARLAQAKAWLLDTDRSIADIAASLGFCDTGYFTQFFCLKTGLAPSFYRKKERKR